MIAPETLVPPAEPVLIDPRDVPALRALASRQVVLCSEVLLPSGRPGVTPGPAIVGEAADARHR